MSFKRNEVYQDNDTIFDKNLINFLEDLLTNEPYFNIKNEEIQSKPVNSTDP